MWPNVTFYAYLHASGLVGCCPSGLRVPFWVPCALLGSLCPLVFLCGALCPFGFLVPLGAFVVIQFFNLVISDQ